MLAFKPVWKPFLSQTIKMGPDSYLYDKTLVPVEVSSAMIERLVFFIAAGAMGFILRSGANLVFPCLRVRKQEAKMISTLMLVVGLVASFFPISKNAWATRIAGATGVLAGSSASSMVVFRKQKPKTCP